MHCQCAGAIATEATPSTLREIASAIKLPRNDNAVTSFAPPPTDVTFVLENGCGTENMPRQRSRHDAPSRLCSTAH
jgi:hypothetical protein